MVDKDQEPGNIDDKKDSKQRRYFNKGPLFTSSSPCHKDQFAVVYFSTLTLYGINCTKRFVHMKRYFDYFTPIFTSSQKERRGFGSHFLGGREVIEDLQ